MGLRNMCECSGTATTNEFMANICPSCLLEGSEVTLNTDTIDFTSDTVNRPSCVFLNGIATLNTSGTGTLTTTFDTETRTFEATFTLSLFEVPGTQDFVILTIAGLDEMGELFLVNFAFGVPEEDLTVTRCGFPTNLNSRGTTSSNLNQFTPMKRLFYKGQCSDL
jgi:hypothetical protein